MRYVSQRGSRWSRLRGRRNNCGSRYGTKATEGGRCSVLLLFASIVRQVSDNYAWVFLSRNVAHGEQTGSSYLTIYTTYFLTTAGIAADRSFEFSTMITCMGLLGILSSFFWAEKIDRRVIFMIGVGVCGLTQLGFAVAWTVAPGTETAGKVVIGLIAIFTFFYTAFGKSSYFLKECLLHDND